MAETCSGHGSGWNILVTCRPLFSLQRHSTCMGTRLDPPPSQAGVLVSCAVGADRGWQQKYFFTNIMQRSNSASRPPPCCRCGPWTAASTFSPPCSIGRTPTGAKQTKINKREAYLDDVMMGNSDFVCTKAGGLGLSMGPTPSHPPLPTPPYLKTNP